MDGNTLWSGYVRRFHIHRFLLLSSLTFFVFYSVSFSPLNLQIVPSLFLRQSADAIDFLRQHKMDFNKWIYEGIPYVDSATAHLLRERLERDTREARKQSKGGNSSGKQPQQPEKSSKKGKKSKKSRSRSQSKEPETSKREGGGGGKVAVMGGEEDDRGGAGGGRRSGRVLLTSESDIGQIQVHLSGFSLFFHSFFLSCLVVLYRACFLASVG